MSRLIDVEVHGGLGDVFIALHETTAYDEIDAMAPDDRARVTIVSHNPFADEIFRWHPKRAQIEVVLSRHFFLAPYDVPETRTAAGLPPAPPPASPRRDRRPIRFYPGPEDLTTIERGLPDRPYLAVAPSASGMEIEDRNLPLAVVVAAAALCRSRGTPIVFLGRTYQGPHAPKAPPQIPSGLGIVNFTDQLSVPGTAEVLRRAGAVLACHSSLLLLSWYERRPVFTLYPRKYAEHDFWSSISPFSFGKEYPETEHMLTSQFSTARLANFLAKYIPKVSL